MGGGVALREARRARVLVAVAARRGVRGVVVGRVVELAARVARVAVVVGGARLVVALGSSLMKPSSAESGSSSSSEEESTSCCASSSTKSSTNCVVRAPPVVRRTPRDGASLILARRGARPARPGVVKRMRFLVPEEGPAASASSLSELSESTTRLLLCLALPLDDSGASSLSEVSARLTSAGAASMSISGAAASPNSRSSCVELAARVVRVAVVVGGARLVVGEATRSALVLE